MEEDNKFIYCSKCGKNVSQEAKFCTNCGNKLINMEGSIKNTTDNIKDIINNKTYKNFKADFNNRDMINFIQKNAEYYIERFKDIQELYKSTSWNWAAFFFNSWWFLYRKMYFIGFGIIIGNMIISSLIPYLSLILSIVIAVCSGLYGNIAYLKHIEKQLNSFKDIDEDIRQKLILNKGGVNIVIPIILGVITAAIFLLIGVFLFMFTWPYYY